MGILELSIFFLVIWSVFKLYKYFNTKNKYENEEKRQIMMEQEKKRRRNEARIKSQKLVEKENKEKKSNVSIINSRDYPDGTPVEMIEAYERQRYDVLRVLLQKVSYTLVGNQSTQEEKDEFKKIMTYFANRDPLYKDMIVKIIPIISKQEGILQSKIYPYVSEYDVEWVRYVLYFAHELGDIRRVKKGRSYQLFTSTYVETEVLEQ